MLFFVKSCTGIGARMSQWTWRETKQHPSRVRSGHQVSCCLISLHFRCDILAPIPVYHNPSDIESCGVNRRRREESGEREVKCVVALSWCSFLLSFLESFRNHFRDLYHAIDFSSLLLDLQISDSAVGTGPRSLNIRANVARA